MTKKIRLRYNFDVQIVDEDKAFLKSEKQKRMIVGKPYTLVLSELQKDIISMEELMARLHGKLSGFEAIYAIDSLQQKGYIVEDYPGYSPDQCAYWNNLGMEIHKLKEILDQNPVSVEFIGNVDKQAFNSIIGLAGVQVKEEGKLKVVVVDDYEREELKTINLKSLETRQPWMLVKPVGVEIWIGPIFKPGETGCWECLMTRLKRNRQLYRISAIDNSVPVYPVSASPSSVQTAVNLTVNEIVKWLYYSKNECIEGKIFTFDTMTLTSRGHVLFRRPQCLVCGDEEYKNWRPKPIELKNYNAFCLSTYGGYRDVPLETTIEKYIDQVSPITGVVEKLEQSGKKDTPIYNYLSGTIMVRQIKPFSRFNLNFRNSTGGKGKIPSQAKAGAICEAIERYSFAYQGYEPAIPGTMRDFNGDAINPQSCILFSDHQIKNRDSINKTVNRVYHMVPLKFDEQVKTEWAPVYSLTHKKFKYLPTGFCYTQLRIDNEDQQYWYPDSNGTGAGNTMEEALLQGLMELVERDSVTIWWYNRLQLPGVDIESLNEPYYLRLIEYYKSINRKIQVIDLTTDLQIPAFAAVSYRMDNQGDILFGFGAHVDYKVGIERALLELNQVILIADITEEDRLKGKYKTEDPNILNWLKQYNLANSPYLLPTDKLPFKKAAEYEQLCSPNVYDALQYAIKTIEKNGMEVLAVDLTRPDVGLNVVRAIVPGLRHWCRRFGPGRLYDVPVKMGWLKTSLTESELNPIEMFL